MWKNQLVQMSSIDDKFRFIFRIFIASLDQLVRLAKNMSNIISHVH